ncbi:MAG: GC-type dockerin domain-anchored protein [Phycisphaerales bacterium JB059]
MRTTLTTALLLLLAFPASAQPYEIVSSTVDAGGGVSSGGAFVLHGTIGQPEAGEVLLGGSFALAGGFWSGASTGPCNVADFAPPYGTHDFTDVLAFLSAFGAMDPAADLAPPFGDYDFTDVLTFLTAFGSGCP